MKIIICSLLFGLAGSVAGVTYAHSLPWWIQSVINPGFYFFLAYTLPYDSQPILGTILDIACNTIFFAVLGIVFHLKLPLTKKVFWLLAGLYLFQATAMVFFGIVDVIGI